MVNINKKVIKSFVIIIIFIVAIFAFFWRSAQIHRPANINLVEINGVRVMVDTAISPEARNQGLSGRPELAEDEGMLFVFDITSEYGFWMKDMNFPIDMIWIAEDGKIVYIKKDARPELYPEVYIPDRKAKYVLEVVSGFSDKNNIKLGDEIKFEY